MIALPRVVYFQQKDIIILLLYISLSLWDYEPLSDAAVHALQFLDVINMKDPGQKSQFYRTTLKDMLPCIPKVLNHILSLNLYVPYLYCTSLFRNCGSNTFGRVYSKN